VKFRHGASTHPTRTEFDNFRIVGDSISGDTASIAYWFAENDAGQDSVIRGGYIENIMTGICVPTGVAISGARFFGLSFENGHVNAADVDVGSSATGFKFYGCEFRKIVALPANKGHLVV
jgi:hypothetical protein